MKDFSSVSNLDQLRVTLLDGTVLEGTYQHIVGMHFVHVRDGSAMGRIEGPIEPGSVTQIERLATKEEIRAERHDRLRGEPFPGSRPRTRDDFEYRLNLLARAIAAETCVTRRTELRYQFDDLADQIRLAQAKRAWVLAEGRFSLGSNMIPSMRDLWFADVASPSLMRKPRPRDFDPDPAVRRKRDPLPVLVRTDPASIPNMLARLRAAGLKARIDLAGEPFYERADLAVDVCESRKSRFLLEGRLEDGITTWRLRWGGNSSAPGMRQYRAALKTEGYQLLTEILACLTTVEA